MKNGGLPGFGIEIVARRFALGSICRGSYPQFCRPRKLGLGHCGLLCSRPRRLGLENMTMCLLESLSF